MLDAPNTKSLMSTVACLVSSVIGGPLVRASLGRSLVDLVIGWAKGRPRPNVEHWSGASTQLVSSGQAALNAAEAFSLRFANNALTRKYCLGELVGSA